MSCEYAGQFLIRAAQWFADHANAALDALPGEDGPFV
jgi:hypothetical protein